MDRKKLLKQDEPPDEIPGPSEPHTPVLPKVAARILPPRFATRWIRNIGRNLLPTPSESDPESFDLPLLRVVDFTSTRAAVWHCSQEKTNEILKEPKETCESNIPEDPFDTPGPAIDPFESESTPSEMKMPIELPCSDDTEPVIQGPVSSDMITMIVTDPTSTTQSDGKKPPVTIPILEPIPTINDQVKQESIPQSDEPSNPEPTRSSNTGNTLSPNAEITSSQETDPTTADPNSNPNLGQEPSAITIDSTKPVTELVPGSTSTSSAGSESLPPGEPKPETSIRETSSLKPETTSPVPETVSPKSETSSPKPEPAKHEIVDESESKRKRKFSSIFAKACNRLRLWDEVRYGTKIPKDEVDDDYVMEMMRKGKLQHGLKYSKEGDDDKVVWPEANYKAVQVDKFTVPKIEGERKEKVKKKDNDEILKLLLEQKEKEKEMEEKMRLIDRRKAFTGLFNDGYRRIDLVIVITKSERSAAERHVKMEFVANLVKHGLEVEVEEGILPRHSHLLFIKVHAPSKFLQEYAEFFGAKKQFKEKHLQFLNIDSSNIIDRTFKLYHEKEWLQLIRQNYVRPLMYSNRERSYITYMVLRCVPFGDHSNYFSINRLIEKKVICDVYALHDGPFYYTSNQDYNLVNARQILFYYWASWHNFLTFQPLTLIHEYFGSKVAFYFALFQFLTLSLTVVSIFGIITLVLGFIMKNPVYDHYKDKVCSSSLKSCPTCTNMISCPFKDVSSDCFQLKALSVLDTDYLILFAIVSCVWAATFVIFWNRFEKYFVWLWELKLRPRWHTVRTEYYVNTEIRRSESTGVIKRYASCFESMQRVLVVRLIMLLLFALIVVFVYISLLIYYALYAKYRMDLQNVFGNKNQYVALLILVTVTLLITSLLQKVFYYICILATKYENHRTIENYEKSLILKVFGTTAACTYVFLIYFSYFKGTFYTLPHVRWTPKVNFTFNNKTTSSDAKFLRDLFQTNCGVFGCLDEAVIAYAALVLGNIILQRLWACFICYKTDYSSLDPDSEPAVLPVWEREYQLLPVTDLEMLGMFTSLIMQFALVTWFVVLIPLAPFIVLVMNLWYLRRTAKLLLVHSRKPVLYNIVGIGAWNSVLTFIAYTSAFTTAVIIAKLTTAITRYTYMMQANATGWKWLFDNYTITYFNTSFYLEDEAQNETFSRVVNAPDYCVFPGMYITSDAPGVVWDYKKMDWPWHVPYMETNPGNYRPKPNKYFKNLFELYFITFFLLMILVLVLVMKYYIPTITRRIKKVITIEEALKKVYEKNVVGKKKKVAQIQPTGDNQRKL